MLGKSRVMALSTQGRVPAGPVSPQHSVELSTTQTRTHARLGPLFARSRCGLRVCISDQLPGLLSGNHTAHPGWSCLRAAGVGGWGSQDQPLSPNMRPIPAWPLVRMASQAALSRLPVSTPSPNATLPCPQLAWAHFLVVFEDKWTDQQPDLRPHSILCLLSLPEGLCSLEQRAEPATPLTPVGPGLCTCLWSLICWGGIRGASPRVPSYPQVSLDECPALCPVFLISTSPVCV